MTGHRRRLHRLVAPLLAVAALAAANSWSLPPAANSGALGRLSAGVTTWRLADDAWWVAFNRLPAESLEVAAAHRRGGQLAVFAALETWLEEGRVTGTARLDGDQGEIVLDALLLARREGRLRLARRTAEALAARLGDADPLTGPTHLALALGALEENDSAAARTALTRAAGRADFPARDYAAQRLVELELTAGDTLAAGTAAETILAVTPPSLRRDRARALGALLDLRRGRALVAAQSAETLLAQGLKGEEAAAIALTRLRARLALGDEATAAVAALRLVADYPTSTAARTGWKLWNDWCRGHDRKLTVPERLAGGMLLLRSGQEEAGRALLAALREENLEARDRVETYAREAEWLFGRRRWDEARGVWAAMEQAAAGLPDRLAEARLGQARCFRNAGQPEPMLRAFRRVSADTGATALAATALWETGREMKSLGRYAEAESALTRYIDRHPYGSDILGVLAIRGFVRLTRGRTADAEADFRALQKRAERRADKEQGAFWAARCALRRGARLEAIEILRAGMSWSLPDGYYGYRMRGLLRQLLPDEPLPAPYAAVVRTEYGNPLEPAGIDNFGTRARAHFDRGVILGRLGLAAEAQSELSRAADLTPSDPAILSTVAGVAARLDLFLGAMTSARRALARTSNAGEETRLWRHVYAPAHFDLIAPAAAAEGLDPMLVTGLIRQESLFDERALSRAGARGLMQLMLPTARQLARGFAEPEPGPDDLYRPELSVKYGTRYLRRKLAEFDGRVEVALAAYNAGESKAREWAALLGTWDPDLYIEQIGYAETRDYVRRVRYNQATYHALYGSGAEAILE